MTQERQRSLDRDTHLSKTRSLHNSTQLGPCYISPVQRQKDLTTTMRRGKSSQVGAGQAGPWPSRVARDGPAQVRALGGACVKDKCHVCQVKPHPPPDPAPKPPSSMLIGLWSSLLAPRHTTLHPASPCWFDGLPASGHSSTCIQPCVCFGRCQMCHVARSSSRPVQSSMCPVGRCSTSHTPMHRRVVPCHWYTAEGLCRPPVGAVQTRRAWT